MKKRVFSILTILLLSSILIVQMIELINSIRAPKATKLDIKIEKPKPIELNEEKSADTNNTNAEKKDDTPQTRPMKKQKFLKVEHVSQEDFGYSKEDYLVKEKTKKTSASSRFATTWEQKVLDSETLIEKSLKQAAKSVGNLNSNLNSYDFQQRQMERFAIKIELPTEKTSTKFTLQYREPPDFGHAKMPEPILPSTTPKSATFSIEKTQATDSPWDNFQGTRGNYP